MEGFVPICFFIFPFLVFVLLLFLAVSWNNENKKLNWKLLAESNHLSIYSGNWITGGAYIAGTYRGQQLRLDTFQKQRGRSSVTSTRIMVAATRSKLSRLPVNKSPLRNPLSEEETVRLLTSIELSYQLRGGFSVQLYGNKICYEQYGVEADTEYLQFLFDLMVEVAENYLQLLAWGGEAVPALQAIATNSGHVLKSIAAQLLRDISGETTQRLGRQARRLYCPRCLTHFEVQTIRLSWWQSVDYCGCRTCGQSRETLYSDHLIAMLDNEIALDIYHQNGDLRVNWLERRHIFDFDQIEIHHATDEDVERFAVQVGNDTDPARKPRYATMQCVVSPECCLSENTTRILARMFGTVTMRDPLIVG